MHRSRVFLHHGRRRGFSKDGKTCQNGKFLYEETMDFSHGIEHAGPKQAIL